MLKGQVCELGMNVLLEFAFHVICVYCTVVEKVLFRALYSSYLYRSEIVFMQLMTIQPRLLPLIESYRTCCRQPRLGLATLWVILRLLKALIRQWPLKGL